MLTGLLNILCWLIVYALAGLWVGWILLRSVPYMVRKKLRGERDGEEVR